MRAACALFALIVVAYAQDQLTNDAIAKMVKAGLGESVIVSMIQSQPGKYSLSPDALIKLKQQGVTDKELAAMVSKNSGVSSTAASSTSSAVAPAGTASSNLDLPPNMEIGVYYKKAGKWEEIE